MRLIKEREKLLNELVVAVKNGDNSALSEIYNLVGGRMLSIAMSVLRKKEWAEDALQDSFERVVRFSDTYKENVSAYSWICTITKNTALNKLKREKCRIVSNIDNFFNISDSEMPSERRDTALLVESALSELEPRERTIVWLRYFNDFTVSEIAKELKIAGSTVHYLLKKSEEKLKEILQ